MCLRTRRTKTRSGLQFRGVAGYFRSVRAQPLCAFRHFHSARLDVFLVLFRGTLEDVLNLSPLCSEETCRPRFRPDAIWFFSLRCHRGARDVKSHRCCDVHTGAAPRRGGHGHRLPLWGRSCSFWWLLGDLQERKKLLYCCIAFPVLIQTSVLLSKYWYWSLLLSAYQYACVEGLLLDCQ